MEKVTIESVENRAMPADVMRPLTEALGATDLALNYYELEPGDSFAYAYHVHEVQEEIFYIQSGTATFETEEGPVEVEAGEVVRFPPGEYQRGVNEVSEPRSDGSEDEQGESSGGDERVEALALGAPLEYGEQVKLRDCSECGERTDQRIETIEDGDVRVTTCKTCGTETGRWTR